MRWLSLALGAALAASLLTGGWLALKRPARAQAAVAPAATAASATRADTGLLLTVSPRFSGEPLVFNDVRYRSAAGDLLGFTRLAFLVTHLRLVRLDGSELPLPGVDGYFDLASGRASLALPKLPDGAYRAVRFDVGVDKARNHADPSLFGPEHALNPKLNGLHWDWSNGYVFFALEARYELKDLAAAQASKTGPTGRLGGAVYHLAHDHNLMAVEAALDLQRPRDQQLTLMLALDTLINQALAAPISRHNGTDRTHTAEGDALATAFVRSMPAAFSASAGPLTAPAMPAQAQIAQIAQMAQMAQMAQAEPKALRAGLTPLQLPLPMGFPQPRLPADNPLSQQGVQLGQRLFFDPALSSNRRQNCAGCHAPAKAFSDQGQALSRGATGALGSRNAQALFNLAWSSSYTWDGRRSRLRDQALAPIADHREMNLASADMLQRLNSRADYRQAFEAVFGSADIGADQVGLALEQYLLSLVSMDSRFDRALQRKAELTEQEKAGLKLFMSEHDPARGVRGGDCFHCHGGALFSNDRFHNNGLDLSFKDRGRAGVTGRAQDEGLFKTPSLRNVALTGPYMHDGRFKTLEQVVEHYSSGTKPSATLDPNIAKHPNQAGVDLDKAEKAALVAFLRTLTDDSLVRSAKR